MTDELKDAIEKNAQGPKSARGDVGEVEQPSFPDQALHQGPIVRPASHSLCIRTTEPG
jgi:hypothetical protein